ncbi:metalloendopeptidase [Coemansia biformis]|uniref:Metalloendopeptidase n=1 Tax=Coemansia biformis TaxID=1286918 RepID=A0A9W8CZU1_9FUNG|nr:metalloendopeptidase [Coemansia biformis]
MALSTLAPSAAPKGSLIDFRLAPAEIARQVEECIDKERAVMDAVAQETAPTFANVIAPLGQAAAKFDHKCCAINFLMSIAVDKEVRDACTQADRLLDEFDIERTMREDVYKVVRAVYDSEDEMDRLDPEDRRLVESMELEYRRAGLLLPSEKREQLATVKKRQADLVTDFDRAVNEVDARVLLTRDELEGLPDDYFDGRETEEVDGETKYVVTSKYPDLFPLMRYAKREATRKTMVIATENRCLDNIPRLQELVKLRLEEAQLLGYNTYSEYAMEILMAKVPQAAVDMEEDLIARLTGPAKRELAELEALKKADMESASKPYTGFYYWDRAYYTRIVTEQRHKLKSEDIRQYFPLAQATRGMLDIYQKMLGLRVVQIDNDLVWHPDVDTYEVWEADEDVFVGHFHLDLYPREGKFNHGAEWPIRRGCNHPDGTRDFPVAALVANFPRPTSTAPSLLPHSDVVTLMHELGHVFHDLCAHTKWKWFHGTRVERDFVEAPSQMLENWAWDPASLRKFAVHHESGEPIPEEVVAKLVAAKNEGAGLSTLTQVFYGLFDLAIHNTTTSNIDVDKMYNDMRDQIALLGTGDVVTHRVAVFTHVAGGYSSRYYGYLWSQVFSADMYAARFKGEGIDNAKTGSDYRTEILCPGSSRDAMESLERFLGRKPDNAAFLESIGLKAD